MPIESKSSRVDADQPLNYLPEMPRMESLSDADRASLDAWWRQVRDVLRRFSDLVSS